MYSPLRKFLDKNRKNVTYVLFYFRYSYIKHALSIAKITISKTNKFSNRPKLFTTIRTMWPRHKLSQWSNFTYKKDKQSHLKNHNLFESRSDQHAVEHHSKKLNEKKRNTINTKYCMHRERTCTFESANRTLETTNYLYDI